MKVSYPITENILLKKIHSFFRFHCSGDFEFKGETHDFWEMMYIVRGSLCVSADERVYNLSSGQIIFHKPLELHKFYITEEKGAEILVVSYTAEGSLNDFFKEKVFLLNNLQQDIIFRLINYAEKYAVKTDDVMLRYLSAFDVISTYSQTVSIYIKELMLSLSECGSELPVLNTDDSSAFTKAVQYMNEHIYDNVSIYEIAQSVNVSTSSLKRIFTKYTGMGIHKYFLKMKLKTAINLLNSGYSVTSVSEKLDFSSQGYFTKVFKRETGFLPSKYKN